MNINGVELNFVSIPSRIKGPIQKWDGSARDLMLSLLVIKRLNKNKIIEKAIEINEKYEGQISNRVWDKRNKGGRYLESKREEYKKQILAENPII